MEFIKDSYGRKWEDESALDQFCKTHRLTIVVEYSVNKGEVKHLDDDVVYTYTAVIQEGNGMRNYIYESSTQYPPSDDYVLSHLKEYFREKHLKELGI